MHQGYYKTVCKIQKLANALQNYKQKKNIASKENNIEYQQFNKMSFEKTLKLLHVKINGCKDIKMIKPEASRKTITRAFAERESQYFEGKRYDL